MTNIISNDKIVLDEYNSLIDEFNRKIGILESKYPNVKSDLMWNYDHNNEGKRRISINKIYYNIFEKSKIDPEILKNLEEWKSSPIALEK